MTVVDHAVRAKADLAPRTGKKYAFVVKVLPSLVLLLDALALLAVGFITYFALVYYSYQTKDFYILAICGNTLLTCMLLYFAGMYQFGEITKAYRAVDRIVLSSMTSFMLLLAAAFTIKISDVYSRVWVATVLVSGNVAIIMLRLLVSWFVGRLGQLSIIARNVAIFGKGEQVAALSEFIRQEQPQFVNVIGVFGNATDDGKEAKETASNNELTRLIEVVRTDAVDDVIVAMPWAEARQVSALMEKLRELPVNVFLSSDLVGYRIPMRAPPNYFETLPLFQVSGKPLSGWDVVIKGIEDYVISLVLVAVLSPLLLVVALLIKLDSPGPVIFKQKRLGFNNKTFNIYKFRSMTYSPVEEAVTVQAKKHDPRVTRIGRVLRKSSIDELPQLFNVLNGTMSIVGPRPHAVDHNEEFSQKIRGYFARHRVKPGLTGLAQVKGFRGLTDTVEKMESRVRYDLEYAENWSLLLDLKIILKTPFALLAATNAH